MNWLTEWTSLIDSGSPALSTDSDIAIYMNAPYMNSGCSSDILVTSFLSNRTGEGGRWDFQEAERKRTRVSPEGQDEEAEIGELQGWVQGRSRGRVVVQNVTRFAKRDHMLPPFWRYAPYGSAIFWKLAVIAHCELCPVTHWWCSSKASSPRHCYSNASSIKHPCMV